MKTYFNTTTLFFAMAICCVYSANNKENEKVERLAKDVGASLCNDYLSKSSKIIVNEYGDGQTEVNKFNSDCKKAVGAFVRKNKSDVAAKLIVHSYSPYTSYIALWDTNDALQTIFRAFDTWDEDAVLRFYPCIREKANRADIAAKASQFGTVGWWNTVLRKNNVNTIRKHVDIEKIIQRRRYKTSFNYISNLMSNTNLGISWTEPDIMALLEFDVQRDTYAFENENVLKDFILNYYSTRQLQGRTILRNKHMIGTPLDVVKKILRSSDVRKLVDGQKVTLTALCSWLGHCRTTECVDMVTKTIKPDGTLNSSFDAVSYRSLIAQSELAKSGSNFLEKFVDEFINVYTSIQNANKLKVDFNDDLSKFMVFCYRFFGLKENYNFDPVKKLLELLSAQWSVVSIEKFVQRAQNINLYTNNYVDFFAVVDTTEYNKVMDIVQLLEYFEVKDHKIWSVFNLKKYHLDVEEFRRLSETNNNNDKICVNYYFTNVKIEKCPISTIESVCKYGAMTKMSKELYELLFDKTCIKPEAYKKLKNAIEKKTPASDLKTAIKK